MGTLTIGGIEITISDDFKSMSQEEQNATVNEIEQSPQFQARLRSNQQQPTPQATPAQAVTSQAPVQPVIPGVDASRVLGELQNIDGREFFVGPGGQIVAVNPATDERVIEPSTGKSFVLAQQKLDRGTILPIARDPETGGLVPALPQILSRPLEIATELTTGDTLIDPNTGRISDTAIEGAVEVAAIVSPASIAGRTLAKSAIGAITPSPGVVGRAGERVQAVAEKQVKDKETDFLFDLIRPKGTKKVKEAEIARSSEEGILKTRVTKPSKSEENIIEAVRGTEGVKKSNSLMKNLSAIQAEITKESDTLIRNLATQGEKIPLQSIRDANQRLMNSIKENPLLVGDATKTARRVVNKAGSLMRKHGHTASGILKARKELDSWVKKQRPKLFDTPNESALTIAVKETRQTMNDLVAESAPTGMVRDSLRRQSQLLQAAENMTPKVVSEAGNSIARLLQSTTESITIDPSLKGNIAQLLALTAGTGAGVFQFGLGTTAAAVGTGAAVLGARRVVKSANAKKIVAQLLKQSDRAIQAAKRENKIELVQKLRLDRSAVIEFFREMKNN